MMHNTAKCFKVIGNRSIYQQPDQKLNASLHINHLKCKENGSQVYIIEIFVDIQFVLTDWMRVMPRGWIKRLPTAVLLLGAMAVLSGCNTVTGAVGGAGRDIAAIGNSLAGVSGCNHPRCGNVKRSCGPRGCRQTRRVVSECIGRSCGGRGYRAPRYERVSYRDQYAYRDRYSYRRDRRCC